MTWVDADAGAGHQVGSVLDVTVVDMQASHDIVRIPPPGEPLRILEKWTCPQCGSREWLEVVVDDHIIRSIEVVPFDGETLDRIHFVTNLIVEFYQDMLGEPYYVDEQVRPDWKDRLRAVLR